MPEKEDYIEMLAKSLQGLRSSVEPADLDLLCTFVYNYSGREVTGALRGMFNALADYVGLSGDTVQTKWYASADADAGQIYA